VNQGPRGDCLMKKTEGRKSRDTVPLNSVVTLCYETPTKQISYENVHGKLIGNEFATQRDLPGIKLFFCNYYTTKIKWFFLFSRSVWVPFHDLCNKRKVCLRCLAVELFNYLKLVLYWGHSLKKSKYLLPCVPLGNAVNLNLDKFSLALKSRIPEGVGRF
jgi:hypothetical protein